MNTVIALCLAQCHAKLLVWQQFQLKLQVLLAQTASTLTLTLTASTLTSRDTSNNLKLPKTSSGVVLFFIDPRSASILLLERCDDTEASWHDSLKFILCCRVYCSKKKMFVGVCVYCALIEARVSNVLVGTVTQAHDIVFPWTPLDVQVCSKIHWFAHFQMGSCFQVVDWLSP